MTRPQDRPEAIAAAIWAAVCAGTTPDAPANDPSREVDPPDDWLSAGDEELLQRRADSHTERIFR